MYLAALLSLLTRANSDELSLSSVLDAGLLGDKHNAAAERNILGPREQGLRLLLRLGCLGVFTVAYKKA